jgi:cytochrome P450
MLSGYDTGRRGLDWVRGCLAAERAESGLAFNPLADAFRRDPEPGYARLRERSPVHFSRLLDCWVVTRHREVDRVLRAPDVFRSDARASTQDLVDPFVLLDLDRPALFLLDPPNHARLRRVINDAFSRAAIERLTPRLEACIREVVESLGRPGDRVDLVPRFAAVLPLHALDLVTGLRTRDVDTVAGWVSTVVRALEPVASAQAADRALEAYHELGAYLDSERTRPVGERTLCGSLQRAVRSSRLTDAEARQLLLFVVLAGTKTATDFLASAARQLTALPVDAPGRRRVDAALIDDLLTLTSPVQLVARTAAESTVLGGRQVSRGQRLLLVLASANRDLAAGTRRDVTFGRGIHSCPGSHLARVQGRLALSMLLETYPGARLVEATASRRCITLRSWESVVVHL